MDESEDSPKEIARRSHALVAKRLKQVKQARVAELMDMSPTTVSNLEVSPGIVLGVEEDQ